jgi:hypothetical protein
MPVQDRDRGERQRRIVDDPDVRAMLDHFVDGGGSGPEDDPESGEHRLAGQLDPR